MDHSSIVYVVGRDGVIKKLIHHGESPKEIAGALKEVLAAS
jgi:cytochrome oxidase Cu insertion factor (SCO1/SenC/PrrC family)